MTTTIPVYSAKLIKQAQPVFHPTAILTQPLLQVQSSFGKILMRSEGQLHVRDQLNFSLLQEWPHTSHLATLTPRSILLADQACLYSRNLSFKQYNSRICFCQADEHGLAVVGLQGYQLHVIRVDALQSVISYTSDDYNNVVAWQNSLVLSGGAFLTCWDINRGPVRQIHNVNDDEIVELNINIRPGETNCIATLGGDGILGLLDPRTHQPISRPKLLASKPAPVILTTQSGFIVVHSLYEIKVFDVISCKLCCSFRTKDAIARIDVFEALVIAMLHHGDLVVYDIDTGKGRWGWGAGQKAGEGVWRVGRSLLIAADGGYGWLEFE